MRQRSDSESRTIRSEQLKLFRKENTMTDIEAAHHCAWQWNGDFCLRPVAAKGDLCDHHEKLAREINRQVGMNRTPKSAAEPIAEKPKFEAKAVEEAAAPKPKKKRRTKVPKAEKPQEAPQPKAGDRYTRQRDALREMVALSLRWGEEHGMTAEQVRAFRRSLEALGQIPEV